MAEPMDAKTLFQNMDVIRLRDGQFAPIHPGVLPVLDGLEIDPPDYEEIREGVTGFQGVLDESYGQTMRGPRIGYGGVEIETGIYLNELGRGQEDDRNFVSRMIHVSPGVDDLYVDAGDLLEYGYRSVTHTVGPEHVTFGFEFEAGDENKAEFERRYFKDEAGNTQFADTLEVSLETAFMIRILSEVLSPFEFRQLFSYEGKPQAWTLGATAFLLGGQKLAGPAVPADADILKIYGLDPAASAIVPGIDFFSIRQLQSLSAARVATWRDSIEICMTRRPELFRVSSGEIPPFNKQYPWLHVTLLGGGKLRSRVQLQMRRHSSSSVLIPRRVGDLFTYVMDAARSRASVVNSDA